MSKDINLKQMKADDKATKKQARRDRRAKVWATAKHYVICVVAVATVVGLVQLGMFIQRQNDGDVNSKVVVRQSEVVQLIQAVSSKLKQ